MNEQRPDWAHERVVEVFSWRRLGVGPKRWDWRRLNRHNRQKVATSGSQGYTERNDAVEAALRENPGVTVLVVD